MPTGRPLTGYVDFTLYGNAERFVAKVDYKIEGKLRVGDIVMLTDYDLAPRPFRVVDLLNDGKAARYELLSVITRR